MFRCFERLKSPFLLFLRVYWGYLFMQAGYRKYANFEGAVTTFRDQFGFDWQWWNESFLGSSLGSFAEVNVFMAGSAEYLFGLLLMIGLFSRLSAFVLTTVMTVAYTTAHMASVEAFWSGIGQIADQGFLAAGDAQVLGLPILTPTWSAISSDFISESPFSYLMVSLVILIIGPGCLAIDTLLSKIFCRKKPEAPAEPDAKAKPEDDKKKKD